MEPTRRDRKDGPRQRHPIHVIGVMPQDIGFPDRSEVWLPLSAVPGPKRNGRRAARGCSTALGGCVMASRSSRLLKQNSRASRHRSPSAIQTRTARPLLHHEIWHCRSVRRGDDCAPRRRWLRAADRIANVANLLLARSADRARDVTLRLALGASRWRIVRQPLREGMLLATAGGICGFILAQPGLQMIQNLPGRI